MPIITISRGTFSGGKDLADCLATQLSYPCVSREVIVEAGEQYGVSEATLRTAISEAPSIFDRFKRDRDRYLVYIRAVLCQHARRGNFIYHGYAGHHLLAGIRHVIRVRVVADISHRISAAMKQLTLTSRQAEAYIKKVDDERRKWTRFLYGVNWDDPANYDVVLNLEYLGISGACAAVVRLTELEQFQPTAESQRALESLALQSSVLAALARDERTREADFRVRAEDGVVTIQGTVKQPTMVDAVHEIASGVGGVTEIVNQVAGFGVPG